MGLTLNCTITNNTLNIFATGFSYDVDGPGQRLVVYLKGCNLCCPWCAAPESIAFAPQVLFYPEREGEAPAEPIREGEAPAEPNLVCAACPYGAVTQQDRLLARDAARCAACTTFACLESAQRAFERVGEMRAVAAIVEQALRYRPFLTAPGGVTIGGGEPTCQFAAVAALLSGLHAEGLHTALETNGTHPDLPALYDNLDLLLIDLKHPRELPCAGLSAELVAITLVNIRRRRESGRALRVRIPLAPGFNADDATLHQFGAALAAAGAPPVEILPFHRRGEVKWHALGLDMPATHVVEPSDELVRHAQAVLAEYGLRN